MKRHASLAELSILALVQNHTLDLSLAALLWALASRRASLIVASPPRLAGKSTLLHAVLDLQPRDTHIVVARGADEDYSFLETADPARTTILVPELSDHLPDYTWGDRVPPLFEAMGRGYTMAATMHAASADEVVERLAGLPNAVPTDHLTRLHAVLTIAVWYDGLGLVRRLHTLSLVDAPAPSNGLPRFRPVAWWEPDTDTFTVGASLRAEALIATRLGQEPAAWQRELSRRREVLRGLLDRGTVEPERVRRAAQRPLWPR